MTPGDPTGRRRAREAALQMLYQWEVGRASAYEAIATYWPAHDAEQPLDAPLREFANALVRGTIDRVKDIDGLLSAHADNWRVERMAVIDRLVLRLAVYEFLADPDIPSRVVINEALELARTYSGEDAVGFVNGVLDSVKKELRPEP
jgi:transcription antitermination protein NusB